MSLLDFLQSASNAVAGNVTGPADLITLALRKAGVPVPEDAVGTSAWAKGKGLVRDVEPGAARVAGETAGILGPMLAVHYAPQIARSLLKAAENAAAPRTLNPQTGAIVWHGSPHKFDKFDSSKIGTGEGAQSYGHGLYLADSPDVAMTYQPRDPRLEQKIMQRYSLAERGQQYPAMQVYEDFLLHKTPQEVAGNIAAAGYSPQELKLAQAALKTATAEYHKQRAGALYKVDLPDEAIARMLDWDKPLSKQAPEVQRAFDPLVAPIRAEMAKPANPGWGDLAAPYKYEPTGQELLGLLRNRNSWTATDFLGNGLGHNVSQFLREKGIPGIRYLDGGSRAAGQGTSNYVVFDDSLLTILERNGIPIR